MASIKRNMKRIFCIILFVVFSPIILLYFLTHAITKSARKRTWKKDRLSGRALVLSSTIDDIDKMEDFEAMDYFKYLFFFDGYKPKLLSDTGKSAQYMLSRGGEDYLMMFVIRKNHKDTMAINRLIEEKQERKIKKAIFITNREVDKAVKDVYFDKMVKILDRNELEVFANRIVSKIKSNTTNPEIEGKNITEMLDIMYPNRI